MADAIGTLTFASELTEKKVLLASLEGGGLFRREARQHCTRFMLNEYLKVKRFKHKHRKKHFTILRIIHFFIRKSVSFRKIL